jgi:hypothetical protein
MALRDKFPEAGTEYLGGHSDGWEYRTIFSGSTLAQSYDMIRKFLDEEGYKEIPLPKDERELLLFRIPTRNKQILMFEDNGYVHNPIKILFPNDRRNKKTLMLCVYNEEYPNHLLKFHHILERAAAQKNPFEMDTSSQKVASS